MKQLVVLMILLQSCRDKFVMPNMVGEDDIDVTKYVKEGYKPVYCDGKIYKLINSKPIFTVKEDFKFLDNEINGWLKENGYKGGYNIKDTAKSIVYHYSYLLTDYPIDVYSIEISIPNNTIVLFLRKDKETLLGPMNTSGWIFSECDKTD